MNVVNTVYSLMLTTLEYYKLWFNQADSKNRKFGDQT
jgi:hypothetical protein